MVSAACLTLGLIYLRFWIAERLRRDYLAFSVICFSVMFFSWFELGLMHSSSPGEYLFWARGSHVPSAVAVISIGWLAHLELRGRTWLFWLFCGTRLLVLAVNFIL